MSIQRIHQASPILKMLQSACAKIFEADVIVTRKVKDYKLSTVKALSLADFLKKFSAD